MKRLILPLLLAACVHGDGPAPGWQRLVQSRIVPSPQSIKVTGDGFYALRTGCAVEVVTPVAAAEVRALVNRDFARCWKAEPSLTIKEAASTIIADGYRLKVTRDLCWIEASDLGGIGNALKTVRQIGESERGVLKSLQVNVPCVEVEDFPVLPFRGMHFCLLPEYPAGRLERDIRLAAYYKFNYAVIESWGVLRLDRHPEYSWDEYHITADEMRRLVKVGKELGITLIPQINLLGHASASRHGSGKHVLLDQHPEYASLFEPDGWTWCISNPATRKYLEEMVEETYEVFDKPPFFHVGCDEAYSLGKCQVCSRDIGAYFSEHLLHFQKFLSERGCRMMMWHDMLLDGSDPRWKGYTACGSKAVKSTEVMKSLPKDVLVCVWEYGYPQGEDGSAPKWDSTIYFKDEGFDVLVCPWLNVPGIKAQAKLAGKEKFFGLLETTWHLSSLTSRMEVLFALTSCYAWYPEHPLMGVESSAMVNLHIRQVNQDLGAKSYHQFGSAAYQIPLHQSQ